jgi:competence protein ComEC
LRNDLGYWLSVCATGGIVGSWRSSPQDATRSKASSPSLLRASASAYLAVAPLSALWFQRWTPLGVFLNLLAVPLAAFLLCSAIALVALGGAFPASILGNAADTGVRILVAITSRPFLGQEIFRLAPPFPLVLCAHVGASAALWLSRSPRFAWRELLATAHLALILPATPVNVGAMGLTLWDVGQGESALLSLPDGSHLIVDTGGRLYRGGTAAQRWVIPALRAQRIRRVRAVALSHLDSDHAAGLEAILAALDPDEVWAPEGLSPPARKALRSATRNVGIPLLLRSRGEQWRVGGAIVEVLSPEQYPPRRSDNDGSLVLRVRAAHTEVLLTGDLESAGERQIAARGLEPVSVLKVSHHGSRGSSDATFLRLARPRAALISAGTRNAWGHPHEDTLERLRQTGTCTLSTSSGGAVRARAARGVLRLERWSGSWETIARLEPARLLLPQAHGHGHERDDEDHQGHDQQTDARAAERLPGHHGRVTIAHGEQQHQPK